MIEANLNKKLNGSDGLIDLDVSIKANKCDFIVITGKSGVGKTSIIKMLAGLLKPDSGYIKINNDIWFDSSNNINLKPNKRKLGYVFQEYALFPNMTVRENLEFAADKYTDKKYIDELLEIVNLNDLSNRNTQTLSGGQKQRVALARALVIKPDILLLDEPLSALDLEMRLKLQKEILKIHKIFKLTTIMITHDIGEIFRLSNKVYIIEKGKIIKSGTPENIYIDNKISGKFKFIAEIIDIKKSDIVNILTLVSENNIVKVIATDEEIKNLELGEKVILASKAFNPLIIKI